MKSTNTDKHLGLKNRMGIDDKFKAIRHKAQHEFQQRKSSNKKKKQVPLPCYEVGDKVVLAKERKSRHYTYVEVLDFKEDMNKTFRYFAIILKVTDKKSLDRIGRLCTFREDGWAWWGDGNPANVIADGIKWIENEKS
jgi:hypothetical protein